jgi:hypothetical protein
MQSVNVAMPMLLVAVQQALLSSREGRATRGGEEEAGSVGQYHVPVNGQFVVFTTQGTGTTTTTTADGYYCYYYGGRVPLLRAGRQANGYYCYSHYGGRTLRRADRGSTASGRVEVDSGCRSAGWPAWW